MENVTEKKEKAKAVIHKAKKQWLPIARFTGYDFDEATGRFTDSMVVVELQQEKNNGKIRCIIVR